MIKAKERKEFIWTHDHRGKTFHHGRRNDCRQTWQPETETSHGNKHITNWELSAQIPKFMGGWVFLFKPSYLGFGNSCLRFLLYTFISSQDPFATDF